MASDMRGNAAGSNTPCVSTTQSSPCRPVPWGLLGASNPGGAAGGVLSPALVGGNNAGAHLWQLSALANVALPAAAFPGMIPGMGMGMRMNTGWIPFGEGPQGSAPPLMGAGAPLLGTGTQLLSPMFGGELMSHGLAAVNPVGHAPAAAMSGLGAGQQPQHLLNEAGPFRQGRVPEGTGMEGRVATQGPQAMGGGRGEGHTERQGDGQPARGSQPHAGPISPRPSTETQGPRCAPAAAKQLAPSSSRPSLAGRLGVSRTAAAAAGKGAENRARTSGQGNVPSLLVRKTPTVPQLGPDTGAGAAAAAAAAAAGTDRACRRAPGRGCGVEAEADCRAVAGAGPTASGGGAGLRAGVEGPDASAAAGGGAQAKGDSLSAVGSGSGVATAAALGKPEERQAAGHGEGASTCATAGAVEAAKAGAGGGEGGGESTGVKRKRSTGDGEEAEGAARAPPTSQDITHPLPLLGPAATADIAAAATAAVAAGMSPHAFLVQLLRERGHPAEPISALSSRYATVPTEKEVRDYDLEVIRAVREHNLGALQGMSAAGRSMNACNRFGESVVHLAMRRGALAVARYLVGAGARLGISDDFGRTPLHDACWGAQPFYDVVALILDEDCGMILVEDCRGNPPLSYARRETWAGWCHFLASVCDRYWPRRSGGPPAPDSSSSCSSEERAGSVDGDGGSDSGSSQGSVGGDSADDLEGSPAEEGQKASAGSCLSSSSSFAAASSPSDEL